MSEFSNEYIPSESVDKQKKLSEQQQIILDRVIAILIEDPKLNEEITKKFEKNLLSITSNSQQFDLLMNKIGEAKMIKLSEIQKQFEKWELTKEWAIDSSKKVIILYTQMEITALEKQVTNNQKIS